MEVEGIIGLLFVTVAVAGGAIWLFQTVATRQENHRMLIAQVAKECALRQTEAARDSIRFCGIVDGVSVELRTYAVARARSTDLLTEARAPLPDGTPKGLLIRRTGMRQRMVASIEGNETKGARLLASIDAPCRRLTEPLWSGMAGSGEVNETNILATKAGTISDPEIIRELIRRVVDVATALGTK
jgi:hypothetical protein